MDGHRLTVDEFGQVGRQRGGNGQGGPADQDRHHADVGGEGSTELGTDEVVRLGQSLNTVGTGCRQPARPDHGEDRIGAGERLVDLVGEVATRVDRGDVEEHTGGPKPIHEHVVEPSGDPPTSLRR